MLSEHLTINNKNSESKSVINLYDPTNESLKKILDDSSFPSEVFETASCLKFLKLAGLRDALCAATRANRRRLERCKAFRACAH